MGSGKGSKSLRKNKKSFDDGFNEIILGTKI